MCVCVYIYTFFDIYMQNKTIDAVTPLFYYQFKNSIFFYIRFTSYFIGHSEIRV